MPYKIEVTVTNLDDAIKAVRKLQELGIAKVSMAPADQREKQPLGLANRGDVLLSEVQISIVDDLLERGELDKTDYGRSHPNAFANVAAINRKLTPKLEARPIMVSSTKYLLNRNLAERIRSTIESQRSTGG
ncbi:MAG: hypothetical protein JRN67_07725 [Nitrososphaerota archaeon]|nr:hypothetical protein [Nitrososphaerota archaeon]